jgi:hypothetical protein
MRAWDAFDLQAGGASTATARRCAGCASKSPAFADPAVAHTQWCRKCCAATARRARAAPKPPLPCALRVAPLRELAAADAARGAPWPGDPKALKGADAWAAAAAAAYLLPWRAPRANDAALDALCDALDAWLDAGALAALAAAAVIRLENQPALTNPRMKSMQMMLFALLCHRLKREHGWRGRLELVHAKVKTAAAAAPAPAAPAPAALVVAA